MGLVLQIEKGHHHRGLRGVGRQAAPDLLDLLFHTYQCLFNLFSILHLPSLDTPVNDRYGRAFGGREC